MPSTKNLAAYTHIARVFEAALAQSGAMLRLETPKAAIRWRQEANYYRTLLRQQGDGTCPYDGLLVRIDRETPTTILIQPREDVLPGILTDLEGAPIVAPSVARDHLLVTPPTVQELIDKAVMKLKVTDHDS